MNVDGKCFELRKIFNIIDTICMIEVSVILVQ
jgi:hypothetical protein